MRFLKAFGAATLVPLVGLMLALYVYGAEGGALSALFAEARACAGGLPNFDACRGANLTPGLAATSIASLAFGLGIIIVYWLVARLCGANRTALSVIFPPLTLITLISIAILTLMHAATVTLALFTAESHWLGQVHDWVLIIAAGAGALAAFGVAAAALRSYGAANIMVIGQPTNPLDQPRLMLLVRNIAKKVGTRPPDNVIVGMDANFFATHAHVHMPGVNGHTRGRSLFLSVPLMRGLSVAELSSVIAHEMAHFRNKDALYSQSFAPIYARLADAGNPQNPNQRSRNPFSIGVRALTGFLVEAFHSNVAKVSQKREYAADQAAAEATSPQDVASSLMKVSIMAHIWHRELVTLHERVHRGRFSRNISRNFAEALRYDLDKDKITDAVASIMAWQIPHPTDSHPATEERIQAVGLNPSGLLNKEQLLHRFFGQAAAADELDDLNAVEERLTFIYQKYLEHIGVARPPAKEVDAEEMLRFVLTDFLAHMITVDGSVDAREIEVAEKEAQKLVPNFEPQDLRERCRHPDDLIELNKLIDLALDLLNPRGFAQLAETLTKIAAADGLQHRSETAMLQRVMAAAELAMD